MVHDGSVVDDNPFRNAAPRRKHGTGRHKAPRSGSRRGSNSRLRVKHCSWDSAPPGKLLLESRTNYIVADSHMNSAKHNAFVEMLDHITKHIMSHLVAILGVYDHPPFSRQQSGIGHDGCVSTRTD